MSKSDKTRPVEIDQYGYMKVAEIEIRTVKYDVFFGEREFRVYVSGEDNEFKTAVTGKSLEELKLKMTEHTVKSKPLNVPFVRLAVGENSDSWPRDRTWTPPTFTRWLIRGIHAGTTNVITKEDKPGSKAKQEGYSHSSNNTFRGDTPQKILDELAKLYVDEHVIIERRKAIVAKYGIRLLDTAREAMKMEHGS